MIGAAVTRREDARILRGETGYLDDLSRPRLAHVAFVRSEFAHAEITGIDVPAIDGVTILTAVDLAGLVRPFPVPPLPGVTYADAAHPVLAADEVRYAGQPVAMVVAESRALAEDAAEAVWVDYESREVIVAPRASPHELMRWERSEGDVAGAFAAADHVVPGSYALPRLAAVPIEPRGAIAEHDPATDRLTVWCSAQDSHRPLAHLGHILDRAAPRLRIIVPDVGGAFGSKGVIAPEVAAVCAGAILLKRPLKWSEDRLENLVAAYQGRGIEGDVELALDGDGRMLAMRARLWADLGGYLLPTTGIPPLTCAQLMTGCYEIPAAEVVLSGMLTHKVPTGPYRGAGRPDAAYMVEALVDAAARELGVGRAALRRRNLVTAFPHASPLGYEYDSGDYARCLDTALRLAGTDLEARAAADGEVVRGTGIALYVERAGGQFESAEIALAASGRFVIASSASPHGQGHETTFAQIAAERLRVAASEITLRFGDSDTVPAGVGTFGSRSVSQAGSAVALAAEELGERARPVAAALLGCDAGAVVPAEAGFAHVASGRSVTWGEIARAGEDLRGGSRFRSPQVFSSGAYVATVEIERATGTPTITRLVAVDDAGTIINPLLVHGQVIGGIVQALGECLTEEVLFDDEGQNGSGSLMDYSLLTAAEIPPIICGEVCTPSPHNPLGAKGAGEGGAVGALPAVANAIADALGGRHLDPPYTAAKLWRALREAP